MVTEKLTLLEKKAAKHLIFSFKSCTYIQFYTTGFIGVESPIKNAIKENKLLTKYLEKLKEMEDVIQGAAQDAEVAIEELEKLLEESKNESY